MRVRRRKLWPVANECISRDDRKAPGWVVHITRRGVCVTTRFFADRKWGGRAKALLLARRYRDEQFLLLDPAIGPRGMTWRNTTGEVGVSLERRRVGGRVYWRYRAAWPTESGAHERRGFEVTRYGKQRAFELAVKARRQGMASLKRRLKLAMLARLSTQLP